MLLWRRSSKSLVKFKEIIRRRTSRVQDSRVDLTAKKKCLCEILRVTLWLSRLFGIAPIAWRHPENRHFFREDGQCEFYVSNWWILYTICITVGYNTMFISSYDFHQTDLKSLSQVLKAVNSWSYYIFSTLLSCIAIFKAKALCEVLNDVSHFLRKGLLCSFSKATVSKTSHLGFVIIIAQLAFQYAALLFMYWNDQFNTRLSVRDFIDKSVHNVPFMFYYLFSTICSIYVGLFMCFDTTLLQTLNFDELQVALQRTGEIPLKDFDEDISSGFNTMEIVRCRGRHLNVLKQSFIHTGTMEDMEKLRRLYKAIRDSLASANGAFNPQITIHLFIELTVLVLHLYKVILYMNIPNKTTDQFTAYCIDWLFVVVHTIGLLIFLLSCQGIRASQIPILQQLNDYTYKTLDPDIYTSLKLFYLKLALAPAELYANRFFTLDISLLAPISASVVTYLLVALQFKIYKDIEAAKGGSTAAVRNMTDLEDMKNSSLLGLLDVNL